VQQVAAQIPWFHNCVILDKIKNNIEREWYIQKVIENGWSRNILNLQIQNDLYNRQGKAINNFEETFTPPQSDLAKETLKDPYIFDFLTLGEEAQEREVETELIKHITKFFLELGVGFAFVGRQYPLKVSEEEFFIDLLFYHIKLHCFVVIELKTGKFKPEYTGKINFYLSAVDDLLKSPQDNPSIGLILCASKDNVIAEYALRDVNKPIGIAEWQAELVKSLPKELQAELPTIEQLEAELEGVSVEIEDEC
jgi:predicted nuclease of restriction endonuclease-like (RecB) superfamily